MQSTETLAPVVMSPHIIRADPSPEISVVIASFRRPRELGEALASALGQTGAEIEIIVDDSPEGSARATVEQASDRRVTYLKMPTPTGGYPSRVRNFGLKQARAPLVHFLDDDDIVPAGHYGRVVRAFDEAPDVGLVFGAIEPFGSGPASQLANEELYFDNSRRLAQTCRRIGTRYPFVASLLFVRALLVCSAGVARRACVEALGGFDERMRVREDLDLFVMLSRRYGVRFLDETTLRFRVSSGGSLMHKAELAAGERAEIARQLSEARRTTFEKYQSKFGVGEFYALRVAARSALRFL